MGNIVRGATISGFLNWPSPAKPKQNANAGLSTAIQASAATFIPDTNAADGSGWVLNFTSAGGTVSVVRLTATGATSWSITTNVDVNAAAVQLLAFLVDYTDSKIYMLFSGASGNAPYFVANPLTTKSPTVTGLTTTFTGGIQAPFLDRPGGQGSGNLRIFSQNWQGATPYTSTLEQRDISTAGVLQGSTTTLTLGGNNPQVGVVPTYVSQAGTTVSIVTFYTSNVGYASVSRNGGFGQLPLASTNRPLVLAGGGVMPIVNGTNITLLLNASSAVVPFTVPRTYARSDWDAFMNTIADAAGCP